MTHLPHFDASITSLSALLPGWLDGSGNSITPATLAWLREVREACARGDIDISLDVYPVEDGGAQLDFDTDDYAVTATFNPVDHMVDFWAINMSDVGDPNRHAATPEIRATISTVAELAALIRRVCQQSAAVALSGMGGA